MRLRLERLLHQAGTLRQVRVPDAASFAILVASTTLSTSACFALPLWSVKALQRLAFLNKKLEGFCRRCCDCRKLFRSRVLVQTGVSKYKCTVCTIFAIRNYHQEECGYKFCSRFCFQDLQTWTKCICCRMACTGYHTVCITHFYHHYTIVWVLV